MLPYQKQFIAFCLQYKVLKFGEFILKSKRPSPYFFNAGEFNDGQAFSELGIAYATTIEEIFSDKYDLLFGPAYKGIPLATCTAMALAQKYNRNIPICFNRKEAKDHGEGGMLIGASIKGKRVLIIDDVMTAGTAFRDSAEIITKEGGTLVGAVIALNRQEKRVDSDLSAVQEMEQTYKIKIASIIDAYTLVSFLDENKNEPALLQSMLSHLKLYGIG